MIRNQRLSSGREIVSLKVYKDTQIFAELDTPLETLDQTTKEERPSESQTPDRHCGRSDQAENFERLCKEAVSKAANSDDNGKGIQSFECASRAMVRILSLRPRHVIMTQPLCASGSSPSITQ